MRLFVGEDHILAVRTLLRDSSESFVWTVPVVGRAALESFGQVRHLTELHIPTRLRSGRTLNELIYSAQNISRLPREASAGGSTPEFRDSQAVAMGLTRVLTKKGKPTEWFEERRPTNTALVARVFGDRALGSTIYNYWSGIAHSSSWGLTQTLGDVEAHPSGFGFQAPVVSSLETLMTTSLLLVLAHLEALEHYMSWNGWAAPRYRAAIAQHKGLFDQFAAARSSDPTPESPPRQTSEFLWTPP